MQDTTVIGFSTRSRRDAAGPGRAPVSLLALLLRR
jgi:hypothetical protein